MSELGGSESAIGLPEKPIEAVKADALAGLSALLTDLSTKEQQRAEELSRLTRVEREAAEISRAEHPLDGAVNNARFINERIAPLVRPLFQRVPGRALTLASKYRIPIEPMGIGSAIVFGKLGYGPSHKDNEGILRWNDDIDLSGNKAPAELQTQWDNNARMRGSREVIRKFGTLPQPVIVQAFAGFINRRFK